MNIKMESVSVVERPRKLQGEWKVEIVDIVIVPPSKRTVKRLAKELKREILCGNKADPK